MSENIQNTEATVQDGETPEIINAETVNPVKAEEDFGAMLDKTLPETNKFHKGDVVEGKIVSITETNLFISLGGKQDAVAEVEDYKDKEGNLPYAVGDTLKGFIVQMDDVTTVISRSLSSKNRSSAAKTQLKEAFEKKMNVQGKITAQVKGGFSVDVLGVRAFCPISQIDTQYVQDGTSFVNQSYEFEIVEYSEGGRNIIVSRRALLEKERLEQKEALMAKLVPGSIVSGKVSRMTSFGAFIDLGGVDGLLHLSEMSWGRIDNPAEAVQIGDEINVKILKVDGDKLSLSLKAITENPLNAAIDRFQDGDVVNCRVLRHESFGSFVEIEPGVEGLIPISQMARGRRIGKPSEVLSIGDLVEAQIIKLDKENKKISLSLKSLQPDPWDNINELLQAGAVYTGYIESIAEFGAFIKLCDGVTGLIPRSKMQYAGLKLTAANHGEQISVRVSEINVEKKRVSLEPSEMPERSEQPRQYDENDRHRHRNNREDSEDWRRFANQKRDVPEDNPFNVL